MDVKTMSISQLNSKNKAINGHFGKMLVIRLIKKYHNFS
jgi:hypothetical protein